MQYSAWLQASEVEMANPLRTGTKRVWEIVIWSDPVFGFPEQQRWDLPSIKRSFEVLASRLAELDAHREMQIQTWRLRLPTQMARVVSQSLTIHERILDAYGAPNRTSHLQRLINELDRLYGDVQHLWDIHVRMLYSSYHPHPRLYHIDTAYGEQMARLQSTKWRLKSALAGTDSDHETLEELELQRGASSCRKAGLVAS